MVSASFGNTWLTHIAPLTEPINRAKALYRSKMKDGLIVLQALLLAMSIAAMLLRKRKLVRNELKKTWDKPALDRTVLPFSAGLPWELDGIELKINNIHNQCQDKLKIKEEVDQTNFFSSSYF